MSLPPPVPSAAIVTVSRRPHMLPTWLDMILHQRQHCVKLIGVTLLLHADGPSIWNPPSEPGRRIESRLKSAGMGVYFLQAPSRQTAGAITNTAMQLSVLWGADLMVKFDDDDYYGPNYCEAMAAAWLREPEAWLLGKSQYLEQRTGGPSNGRRVIAGILLPGPAEPGPLRAEYIAGPTFVHPTAIWKQTGLRYPDIGLGCDGGYLTALRQRFMRSYSYASRAHIAPGEQPPWPIFHVEAADFVYQRYYDPAHQHAWQPNGPHY